MSYCKSSGPEGKDRVIFLTEEDATKPSTIDLPETKGADAPQGLITESGEINWDCPCLGGMAVGPCGVEFREAFSCFHYIKEEPKGADCLEQFQAMQECMKDYPELYEKESEGASMLNTDDKEEMKDVQPENNDTLIANISEPSGVSNHSNNSATNDNISDHISDPSPSSNVAATEEITGETSLTSSTQTSTHTDKQQTTFKHTAAEISESPSTTTASAISTNPTSLNSQAVKTQES